MPPAVSNNNNNNNNNKNAPPTANHKKQNQQAKADRVECLACGQSKKPSAFAVDDPMHQCCVECIIDAIPQPCCRCQIVKPKSDFIPFQWAWPDHMRGNQHGNDMVLDYHSCRTPCVFNETLNCFLLTIRIMTMMMTMIMMTMTITMTVVRTNNRQVSREGHWQLPLHAKLEDEEAVEIIHDDDEPTEAFLGCLELRAACARMKKEEYNSVGDDDDDYDNDEKSSRSHSKSSSLICWSTPKKLRNSTPVVWMCCTRG